MDADREGADFLEDDLAPDGPGRCAPHLFGDGTFRTLYHRNGGADWKRPNPNVPRLTTVSLLALPGTILAGGVPAAVYTANNGGWQELGACTRFLASDNEAPHCLYAPIEVGGLLVSDDAGQRWSPATKGLDDSGVHQVLPARRQKDSLSSLVVKAPIAARIAGNIGKMLHRQKIAPSVPPSRKGRIKGSAFGS
jgi:hypothetical protein